MYMSMYPDFWKKVDEKRKQGMTDTAILDGLSANNPQLSQNINSARAMFTTDANIKDDRELLNFLSNGYSGKVPIVASVPGEAALAAVETKPTSVLGAIGEFGTGIKKGAASSLLGVASLPQKTGEWIAEKIIGKEKVEPYKIASHREKAEATGMLEAKTTIEQYGKTAEQIGEFVMSPGTKVKALKKLPLVKDLFVRGIKEGATFSGLTAAQEGEINKEVGYAGAIGAVSPIPSKLFSEASILVNKVGAKAKPYVQEKLWNKVLNDTSVSKDIGKLGITGYSKSNVYDVMTQTVDTISKSIIAATKTTSKRVNVDDLRKDILKIYLQQDKLAGKIIDPKRSSLTQLGRRFDIQDVINKHVKAGQETISLQSAYKLQLSIAREIEKLTVKKDIKQINLMNTFSNELDKILVKAMPSMKNDIDKISILSRALIPMKQLLKERTKPKTMFEDILHDKFDVASIGLGIATGSHIIPLVIKKGIETTLVQTSSSKFLNMFRALPENELLPIYLGTKGILAGAIDRYTDTK